MTPAAGQRITAIWQRMMASCTEPTDEDYPHIGGMGVMVCAAWQSLDGFLAWVETQPYNEERWLIRDAPDLPFAPRHCRWVSGRAYRTYCQRLQVYNAFGERKALAGWLRDPRLCVSARQVCVRLQRGWSLERAMTERIEPRIVHRRYSVASIPVGARFGRITVIGPCVHHVYRKNVYVYLYECRCDCGVIKNINGSNLLTGDIVSCGCFRKEVAGQHQRTFNVKTPKSPDYRLYRLWRMMTDICSNARHLRYQWYGGQGIRVCVAWARDFGAFREWARQHGYTDTLYLHRRDCSADFSPENCYWEKGRQRASFAR